MSLKIIHPYNIFQIESSSQKGKFYKIDPSKPSCTYPRFMYREMGRAGVCKDITSVKRYMQQKGVEIKPYACTNEDYNEIIIYLKQRGNVDAIVLIEQFSKEAINDLIKRGALMKEKGKIRCLE